MSEFFVTPRTVARQVPLSMEFFRQKYWNGLLFPLPGHINVEASKYEIYVSGLYREMQDGFYVTVSSLIFSPSLFLRGIF